MKGTVQVVALYVSRGHIYVGHHGREPGVHGMERVERLDCRAGRGVIGDRYLDHSPGYKGQITFFEEEVHLEVCHRFGVEVDPWVYRRNVLVRGVRLGEWIGKRFEVQGTWFEGTEECRPCYWMDRAVTSGVEAFLKGRGGLRARILTDGLLEV